MDENLSFLGGLPEGLLTAEQQTAAQDRARQAAALQLGLGMIAGAQGQRGAGKPGLAQIIGQAGPGALQAYQGSFDNTLRNMLIGKQLADARKKELEQEQLRTLLPQVFKTTRGPATQEMIASEQGDDYLTRPGGISGVQIDPTKLQALMMIPGGMDAVKGLAETQTLLRKAGLTPGAGEALSPFATYLQAQSPQVRELAKTYEQGFKSGVIDEDTAYKRIEALGRMEDAFISRDQARLDRLSRETQAQLDRDAKKAERDTTATDKLQSQIKGIDLSAKALTDLKEIVAQKGTAYLKRDEDFADLKTAYQKALFNLKDLYELGALQAGDVEQINYLLQDPTSLSGWYLGKEGVLKSIESVEGLVRDRAEALKRVAPEKFKSMVIVPTFPTISDVRQKFNLEGKK